ncbi:MAG TPA: VOC family protein [Candidatus Binatia bacterium]|nr:VOC family protein [Candidatus Binatia bacterium]
MPVDVVGIDHVYLAVSDLARSEAFYDRVMLGVLGFRKGTLPIAGEPHRHYYNRHYGFSIRPARHAIPHDPYAPGLHHFCFRVEDEAAVRTAATELRARAIDASEPRYYPEYAPDYFATFFEDPDGIRLEITNFRQQRKQRMVHWNDGE